MPDQTKPERFVSDAERWDACLAHDSAADGYFYYGVSTTGVYCRPSCGARRPLREHVRFYTDIVAAEAAGLRACRRCRPDRDSQAQRYSALIARACRVMQSAESMPNLDVLARQACLSRFHFHRLFKRATGLAPAAYRRAQRAQRVRAALLPGQSVTAALYDAGYGSNGRFYESSGEALGMSVAAYRRGGQGKVIRFAIGRCSLGELLVAATPQGVCAIFLGDDAEALLAQLQQRFARAQLVGADHTFEQLIASVAALVEQPQLPLQLPLDIQGTAFQHRVWQALRNVPYGTTISYSELAQRLGLPRAVRAVAQAVAANPLAIAIPCHRVIRSDGALSGYRWGIARKRRLLEQEGAPR